MLGPGAFGPTVEIMTLQKESSSTRLMPHARLILLIAGAFAGILAFLSLSTRMIILPSFVTIEEAAVAAHTRRVLSNIAGEIRQLAGQAGDYAGWDDTYRFIRDGNRDYVESNLIDSTYEKLNLNCILFIDEDGRLVHGKGFDPARKTAVPLPDGLGAHLTRDSLLLRHANPESVVAGILELPQGPLLIASVPILTSSYQGPIRGSLLMGRVLDAAAVERVSRATLLPVRLARVGSRDLPAGVFAGADGNAAGGERIRVVAGDEELATGYGLLRDIYGKPVLAAVVTLPRDISLQGKRSIRFFLFLFAGIGLAVCMLMYLLLGQLLLFRQQREAALERYRALNEELGTANKELEAFSYSVSHDLRAPLRAIEGFSGIVSEQYGAQLGDEGRRLLDVVRANTMKMSRLIDDLLAFSRSSRGEIRHERLDMAALARSAYAEIVGDPEARARIDFKLGDLPEADGDGTLLRQVWVNLLSNAVKFSSQRERAVIEVAGEVVGDEAVYHVRDNGAGFDMRYSDKLYGVFQRLHAAEPFAGTGIGLALVKRIVTRHGGRVWAEAGIDTGATFFFTLPRRRDPAVESRRRPG